MAITSDMQAKMTKLPEGKSKAKLSAGAGLYLLINKSGKYWRYEYKYDGKRKEASVGIYAPNREKHVSLKVAKSRVQEIKNLLSEGVDPNQRKREVMQENIAASEQKRQLAEAEKEESIADENTFEVVGRMWFELRKSEWVDSHAKRQLGRLDRHLFPVLGNIPVTQLTKVQVADALLLISNAGSHDIAHRMAQITRSILNYACNRGLIDAVPMGDMRGVLPTPVQTKMPAITAPEEIGELMRAIYAYKGTFVVCRALRLLPLLAARSGEFRLAEWHEFDFENALWTIPAVHRKLKKKLKEDPGNVHLVPLSQQALVILKELHQLTGGGKHLFPSVRGGTRTMSENTINTAFAIMGLKGQMVGHGVRSMFSTVMNEQGFNPDAIERQLAHVERNQVRAAYNEAEYLSERVKMMQHWADYLDGLRDGNGE